MSSQGEMMSNKVSVTSEIMDERNRQDRKWGGPRHDDQHSPADWLTLILERLDRADMSFGEQDRSNLLEAAALAVAAIESFDRTERI